MLIGYARVSTHDQHLDLQEDALKRAGCEKVFVDRVSGTVAERLGLAKVKELLRKGDPLRLALGSPGPFLKGPY